MDDCNTKQRDTLERLVLPGLTVESLANADPTECSQLRAELKSLNLPHALSRILDCAGEAVEYLAELKEERNARKAELKKERNAQKAKLKKERNAQNRFEITTECFKEPNFILALHWVLNAQTYPEAVQQLALTATQQQQLQLVFDWTVSFSQAFFSGGYEMLKWFESHHFLQECDTHEKMDMTAETFTTAHLADIFQNLPDETDKELVVDSFVREGGMPSDLAGVKDLWLKCATAQGTDRFQCVALLAHFPVFEKIDDAAPTSATGDGAAADDECMVVPGTVPQLNGAPKVISTTARVKAMPFVFTAPRIHAIINLASACASEKRPGLKLAGVHGAGKTVLARMLAQCLPAGSAVDVWHVANAEKLWEVSSSGPTLCYDFLRQSTGCRINAHLLTRGTADDVLNSWWQKARRTRKKNASKMLPGSVKDLFSVRKLSSCVVLLDKVNEVCGAIQKTVPAAHSPQVKYEMGKFVCWRLELPRGVCHMQIGSPDGRRESVAHKVHRHLFFELRPAPAAHIAAVLHAAPSFLAPGTRHIFQLVDTQEELRALTEACSLLSGNMRYITATLEAVQTAGGRLAASGDGTAEDSAASFTSSSFTQAALETFDDAVVELAERINQTPRNAIDWQRHCFLEHATANDPHFGGEAYTRSVMLRQYLELNASLSVRKKPTDQHSHRVAIGRMNMAALRQAAGKCAAQGAQASAIGNARTSDLMHALLLDDTCVFPNGMEFESYIGLRLCMQRLARSWYDLTDLSKNTTRVAADLSGVGTTLWQDSLLHCKKFVFRECSESHIAESDTLEEFRKLPANGASVLVIHTGPNAPFCNYVVVQKFPNGQLSVVFVKCTTSDLHQEAKRSLSDEQKASMVKLADPYHFSHNVALADIWRLTHFDAFAAGVNHPAAKGLSVANFWLQQLGAGAQLELTCTGVGPPPKLQNKWKLECNVSEGKRCNVACVFVSQDYLSAQFEDLEGFSALESSLVRGVGIEELNLRIGHDDTPLTSRSGSPSAGGAAAGSGGGGM